MASMFAVGQERHHQLGNAQQDTEECWTCSLMRGSDCITSAAETTTMSGMRGRWRLNLGEP
jgi:hypothetical protein